MKKAISFILCFAVTVCSFVFVDFTSYAYNQDTDIELTRLGETDTYYKFDAATKTITISGQGATPDYENASNSQPWYSWRGDGSVENLVVEEGVTALGAYMFYYTSLSSVSLPSSLKKIGSFAFAGIHALTGITLPEGLETISNSAFYLCRNLESIKIPSGVTSIGESAFNYCSSLSSLEFEKMSMNVTIGQKAFFDCASLTQVTLPKGVKISERGKAFGYYKTYKGEFLYEDFVMNVYRDSSAYTYAVSKYNYADYNLIGEMEIFEGDTVGRTYYADSADDTMKFYFTPEITDNYKFYSSGSVDADCVLTDSEGNIIAKGSDISSADLNFYIRENLNESETYCFAVSSVKSTGDFSVTLYPADIEMLNFDYDTEFSCSDAVRGKFDVLGQITGRELEVIYKRGFSEKVTFENDKTFYEYIMTYSDNQSESRWLCGEHTATVSFGDVSRDFTVTVNHSYEKTVVEPTISSDGYSLYRCYYCGDTYKDEFVDRLGVRIYGRAVLMETPYGDHSHNFAMPEITVAADGVNAFTTGETGEFEFYVMPEAGVLEVSLTGDSEVTRKRSVDLTGNKDINLGDVALCSFDYNRDGYINAKDFAVNRYAGTPEYWQYAENFFAYGKIDESIYNNIQ